MKTLTKLGLALLSIVFLAGCGSKVIQQTPVAKPAQQPAAAVDQNSATSADNSQSALPATVSTQPAANVDQEVNNINKDLNAADTNDFNSTGLSNQNVGL